MLFHFFSLFSTCFHCFYFSLFQFSFSNLFKFFKRKNIRNCLFHVFAILSVHEGRTWDAAWQPFPSSLPRLFFNLARHSLCALRTRQWLIEKKKRAPYVFLVCMFSGWAAHRDPWYLAAEPLSLRYLAAELLNHVRRPSLRYLAAEPRNHVQRPSRLAWGV